MTNHVPEWRARLATPAPIEASGQRPAIAAETGWLGWSQDRLSTVDEIVSEQVQRHPVPVLGVALLLGVAIGWLIKKR